MRRERESRIPGKRVEGGSELFPYLSTDTTVLSSGGALQTECTLTRILTLFSPPPPSYFHAEPDRSELSLTADPREKSSILI